VPEYVPDFVGIIRCNHQVTIEREALTLYLKPSLGYAINNDVARATIGLSGGVKSRSKELLAYLDCLEDVKRKLVYNAIFHEHRLPFSEKERMLIEFITLSFGDILSSSLFHYAYGKVEMNGG
jgi:hypothetical protein